MDICNKIRYSVSYRYRNKNYNRMYTTFVERGLCEKVFLYPDPVPYSFTKLWVRVKRVVCAYGAFPSF